jgi:hypothetical protein
MAAESQILTKREPPYVGAQPRFTKDEPARTKQHLLCKTKPISGGLLMTVTSAITSTYEHKPPIRAPKNKANFKPSHSPPRPSAYYPGYTASMYCPAAHQY